MNLKHITTACCPMCGSDTIVAERVDTSLYSRPIDKAQRREVRHHTNGQRWESREFLCGHVVRWTPNFSAEEEGASCRHTEEFRLREEELESVDKEIKKLQDLRNTIWSTSKVQHDYRKP